MESENDAGASGRGHHRPSEWDGLRVMGATESTGDSTDQVFEGSIGQLGRQSSHYFAIC